MSLDANTTCYTSHELPDQRSDHTETTCSTWIYFLGVGNEERIKIGHSRQRAGKRMQQHERSVLGDKIAVQLLCEVRGKVADEGVLKRHFSKFATDSAEVFRPESELIEYIRWLRDQWFVAMPDLDIKERDALPAVDSGCWLPNTHRRKPRPKEILPGMLGVFELGDREVTGDDFYTNAIVIEKARRLMGAIDLDPASHAVANRVVKATQFYTITDNGLTHAWAGRVWINPPFSAWSHWVPKIISEWRSGRIAEMCVLSAMRTVTAQYFAPLLNESTAMCIMHGRIRFWGGVAGDSPDDGHAVFYFGQNIDGFRQCFSELGTVFSTHPGGRP